MVKTRAQRAAIAAAQTFARGQFAAGQMNPDPAPFSGAELFGSDEDNFPFTTVINKKESKKGAPFSLPAQTAFVTVTPNASAAPTTPHFPVFQMPEGPPTPADAPVAHVQAVNYPSYSQAPVQSFPVPAADMAHVTSPTFYANVVTFVETPVKPDAPPGISQSRQPAAFSSPNHGPEQPQPQFVEDIDKHETHWVSAVQRIDGYSKITGYFVNDANELCDKWLLSKKAARKNPD